MIIRFLIFIFIFAITLTGVYKLIEWIFDVNIWFWLQKSLFWKYEREDKVNKEIDELWKKRR